MHEREESSRGAAEVVRRDSAESSRESLVAEQWRRVAGIVEVALELDRPTRALYVETMVRQDRELRRRVLGILRSMDAIGGEEPGGAAGGAADGAAGGGTPEDLAEEDRIGPWRIVRLLGRGGMGVVFLAERDDEEYERRVAIKVIGHGFQKPAVYRRFLAERQILATFDHAHIAKLFDGGTARDGRPYLVMEYVDGEAIDAYCFSQDLTLEERLRLFRKVCSAVAYAHRQLVVHRDLKPTNILVGADGEPKLLDFGIAKLLEPEALLSFDVEATRTTQAVMTPTWASPEQLEGAPISTSSDVYSLGLVLFRLLTGALPPRGGSGTGLGQDSSRSATKPSRRLEDGTEEGPSPAWTESQRPHAARQLRGDLDNIVMKALRPEPEKRYPSVEALDEDIERFLGGRPVTATRDTPLYLLRKMVSRYRWQVVALALFVFSILSTAGVALWQAEKVRAERDRTELARVHAEEQARRAESQAARAEASQAFLADLLQAADATERAQEDLSVRDLLVEGLDRLEDGAALAPEARVDLLELISDAFFRFREFAPSARAQRLAYEIASSHDLPEETQALLLADLARLQIGTGDLAGAEESCLDLLQRLPESAVTVRLRCYYTLDHVAHYRGDFRQLARLLREKVEEAARIDPPTAEGLEALCTWAELGQIGVIGEAQAIDFLESLARLVRHELPAEQRLRVHFDIAHFLVDIAVDNGRPDMARRVRHWVRRHQSAAHEHDMWVADTLLAEAEIASALGEVEESLRAIEQAESMTRSMLDIDARDLRARYLAARAPHLRGEIWLGIGREEKAREAFEQALARLRPLADSEGEIFFIRRSLARSLMRTGRLEEARPLVLDLLEKGYRKPRFLELVEEYGLMPDSMPPAIEIDTALPPRLEERFDAARHLPLPWEEEPEGDADAP